MLDKVIVIVQLIWLVARRLAHPVKVKGRSMEPTLFEGDLVAVRELDVADPKIEQIVTADIEGREVVKRVTAITADGIWLAGDNRSMSTDPGPVPLEAITGVVQLRYWPLFRRRSG